MSKLRKLLRRLRLNRESSCRWDVMWLAVGGEMVSVEGFCAEQLPWCNKQFARIFMKTNGPRIVL